MRENFLKLLDCTLRDGGYINNWGWGFSTAKTIINFLVKSGIDIIEVGFLRNIDSYNPDITVSNTVHNLNKLLPDCVENRNVMFSAMAMCSNYDIEQLEPYKGNGIEMIRITAHDYDIEEGLEFALKVKELGYKVSINPINIMGYTDCELLSILKKINYIKPYQFSIVDTFGSMRRRDLDRIVSLVDHNLNKDIRLNLHLHENMSLGCLLAQNFIDKHLSRPISIDGSLMGMGRNPGNLPIELIADYLNEYMNSNYDLDYMMDAIQDYIEPLHGKSEWGYTPAYFLSAHHNSHRNYAEYYLSKGTLTNREINLLLSRIENNKKSVFDSGYAENLYYEYQNNIIDDSESYKQLECVLNSKKILVMAPGATIEKESDRVKQFIKQNNPVVIFLNFVPDSYKADFVFCNNNKRYQSLSLTNEKLIITSNIKSNKYDFCFNYNSLTLTVNYGTNSLLMLLKLLSLMKISKVYIAGADGYRENEQNYYSPNIRSYSEHSSDYNREIGRIIKSFPMKIIFVTESEYNK